MTVLQFRCSGGFGMGVERWVEDDSSTVSLLRRVRSGDRALGRRRQFYSFVVLVKTLVQRCCMIVFVWFGCGFPVFLQVLVGIVCVWSFTKLLPVFQEWRVYVFSRYRSCCLCSRNGDCVSSVVTKVVASVREMAIVCVLSLPQLLPVSQEL